MAAVAAFRSLHHRNFRLFASGQIISLTGTWMQLVAQSWLVYRLTGSAALLGLVGFASHIPVFIMAPLGGAVADRYPRRSVILATQSVSMGIALVLAALTLTGMIEVWHIIVLAAGLGLVNAFDIPARQSFLVEMVGSEDLINAIGLNSSMFNGARMVGPAIAGVLVAWIGEGWCFLLNGLSYLAVLAGLIAIRLPARVPLRDGPARKAIGEGFSFVARHRPIRALLLLLGAVSLAGMPFSVLMPIFADRVLGAGADGYGILMASSGIGAMAGALALAGRRDVRGLGRWVATGAAAFGIGLVAFSLSRSFWLSAVLLVPVGFAVMIQMASSNTLIQTMVPDRLRGRVMAVYSMMFMGMAPLGSILAGFAAERFGAPWTVGVGGLICVAGAATFRWSIPRLRADAERLLVAQHIVAGQPPGAEPDVRAAAD